MKSFIKKKSVVIGFCFGIFLTIFSMVALTYGYPWEFHKWTIIGAYIPMLTMYVGFGNLAKIVNYLHLDLSRALIPFVLMFFFILGTLIQAGICGVIGFGVGKVRGKFKKFS